MWQDSTLNSRGNVTYGLQLHFPVVQDAIEEAREIVRCLKRYAAREIFHLVRDSCSQDPAHRGCVGGRCGERSTSRVISLGAKMRNGGPQKPVPRLV